MRDGRCGRTAPFDLCARWGMAAMRPTCPRWALFRVVERSSRCYVDRNATARGAYRASDRGSRWILIITPFSSGHNWQIQKLPPRLASTDGRISALVLEKKGGLHEKSGAVWEDCGRCDELDAQDRLYICHFRPDEQGVKQKRQWVMDCIAPRGVAPAWIHLPTTRSAPRDGFARLPRVQAQRVPGRQGTGRVVCPAASCRGGFGARYTGSYLVKCDI